jgi:hypothetical protein
VTHDEKLYCHLRDSINWMLPLRLDRELLTGGIQSASTLHEMAIHKKKQLAYMHYETLAAKLATNLSLSPSLFYGVPIAMTGEALPHASGIKLTSLDGSVFMKPVWRYDAGDNTN